MLFFNIDDYVKLWPLKKDNQQLNFKILTNKDI